MTFHEAQQYAAELDELHPEGCSCGSPDCLSQDMAVFGDWDRERLLAEIVRDQTDWESMAAARSFCRTHGISARPVRLTTRDPKSHWDC